MAKTVKNKPVFGFFSQLDTSVHVISVGGDKDGGRVLGGGEER